jgi:hypothetical protein
MMFFRVYAPCGLVDKRQSFGRYAVSIFRAEAIKMEKACSQSTQCLNPKEYYHNHHLS